MKLLIQKKQELGTIASRLSALVDIIEGTATVQARALNDGENQERTTLLAQFTALEAEIEQLEIQERATQVARQKAQPKIDEQKRVAGRFSYLRAAQLAAKRASMPNSRFANVDFGVEEEMDQEAQRAARESNTDLFGAKIGVGIPTFIHDEVSRATAATAANAGNLITKATNYTQMDFLYPKTVLEMAGAQVMDGLVGTIDLPSGDAVGTYAYNTESGTAAAPGTTFSLKSLAPKRGALKEPLTMSLINQTSFGVQQFFANHFGLLETIGMEKAFLKGGASNEPVGLAATGGIPVVAIGANGGGITETVYDTALTTLKSNNGVRGPISLIVTPAIASRMANLKRDTGSGVFLLNGDTGIAKGGVRVLESNLLPTTLTKGSSSDCHAMILGDFTRFIIMKWAFSALIIDPYSSSADGVVNIVLNSFNNCYWNQDKAFVNILDARDA